MELVAGVTLDRHLGNAPKLDDVVRCFRDVAHGLAAAHERELVHRDLKPANVLVAADGTVKISDFGLSRRAGDVHNDVGTMSVTDRDEQLTKGATLTHAGQLLGTPAYMAPEQFQGGMAGSAADLFALGIALHELVYGIRPFHGTRLDALRTAVLAGERVPTPVGLDVPPRLVRLIDACLQGEPHERPSAARVASELDAIHQVLHRSRTPFFVRRGAMAAAALLAVGCTGFLVARGHPRTHAESASPTIDRAAASILIQKRTARAPEAGPAQGDPFPAGGTYVQRVAKAAWYAGQDEELDHAWVVANPRRQDAYLVRDGFLEMYEALHFSHLGAPVEDEHSDRAHLSLQRFENGFLTWDKEPWRGHASQVAELMAARERAVAGAKFVRDDGHHDLFLGGYRATGRCNGRVDGSGPTTKGWLVVNPSADGAFTICGLILDRYTATDPTSGRPTYELLGLPRRLERRLDDRFELRFEEGALVEEHGNITLLLEHAER